MTERLRKSRLYDFYFLKIYVKQTNAVVSNPLTFTAFFYIFIIVLVSLHVLHSVMTFLDRYCLIGFYSIAAQGVVLG